MCHRINAATPVTPTAAVCIALLAADRALTLDEVLVTVRPLAEYVAGRDWPVAGGASLTDRSTLRWALRELTRSGVLTSYSGGHETVWGIDAHQHLIAAVYRNSAVHMLLVRAIAELALQAVAESTEITDTRPEDGTSSAVDTWRTAVDEALRLRELLKFDFFFAQRDQFLDELAVEIAILARPDIAHGLDVTPEQARDWLAHARPLVAHLVLRPFLDAYHVLGEQLATLDDEEAQTTSIQHVSQRVGRQWALQRILASQRGVGVRGDVRHRAEAGRAPRPTHPGSPVPGQAPTRVRRRTDRRGQRDRADRST
jgi:glycerol-3-phosphate O-acyltransferase